MKHEITLDREIEFMIEHQLSAEQFYVLRMLLLAQEGNKMYLSAYYSQIDQTVKLRDLLISLQEKGVILKSYKLPKPGSALNLNDISFSKKITNSYFKHTNDLGFELWENYPSIVNIRGRSCSLRNISKHYQSLDEFCFAYGKAIKFDSIKHNEILKTLQFAEENSLIHYGIVEFVISRKWEEIDALREGGGDMNGYINSELV